MLYIDLRPGQTCHSKVMHREEVTHSDGSYEKKSRRRTWLKKWDNSLRTGSHMSWRSHKLETRCGRESHHPAEGAFETPDWVWRPDQLVTRRGRESPHSDPRLSSPRERERHNADGHKCGGGVNILQFYSVPNSLSNLSNKVRGIFF